MPKSRSSSAESSSRAAAKSAAAHAAPANGRSPLREKADALYRAARECCHQHERYARVVTADVEAGEEQAVSKVVGMCDAHVRSALEAYERAVSAANGKIPNDDWMRSANALWLASREWVRRHATSDEATRRLTRHTPERLGEIAVEYDLEASALLALQQALAEYRKVAPEAELNGIAGQGPHR